MKTYKLSELVLDVDMYPRGGVDSHHVGEIADAIQAGADMPPLVICKASKRIADGFHRWKAYRRIYGEDHEVQCIEKTYRDDAELFIDAMNYNAAHGRALTQHDKVHCLLLADKLKIEPEVVAGALKITTSRIGELRTDRIGKIGPRQVPLKQTIRHMAGRRLNKKQAAANEKLSGMNQLFYVNQIMTLIDSDLIDTENEELIGGLSRLQARLEQFFRQKAA